MIVECLFVGAHSDVRIHEELEDDPDYSGTSGRFDAPYSHVHNTRQHRYQQRIVPDPTGVHLIPYCLRLPAGSDLLKVLWLRLFSPGDK